MSAERVDREEVNFSESPNYEEIEGRSGMLRFTGERMTPDELFSGHVRGVVLEVLGNSDDPLSPEDVTLKTMDKLIETEALEHLPSVDFTKRPLSTRINSEIIYLLESEEISHTKKRELVRKRNEK